MERDSAVLRLDKICKSFGGLQVLAEVDLNLGQEEIVGLIGPNGAGKSTLFNVITNDPFDLLEPKKPVKGALVLHLCNY